MRAIHVMGPRSIISAMNADTIHANALIFFQARRNVINVVGGYMTVA